MSVCVPRCSGCRTGQKVGVKKNPGEDWKNTKEWLQCGGDTAAKRKFCVGSSFETVRQKKKQKYQESKYLLCLNRKEFSFLERKDNILNCSLLNSRDGWKVRISSISHIVVSYWETWKHLVDIYHNLPTYYYSHNPFYLRLESFIIQVRKSTLW